VVMIGWKVITMACVISGLAIVLSCVTYTKVRVFKIELHTGSGGEAEEVSLRVSSSVVSLTDHF
jgi:hypothetical protein